MRIEYGWYPEYNIWGIFVIDRVNHKDITKEFEYAGNIETARFIIRNYCKKYQPCSVVRTCSNMEELNKNDQRYH